LLERCVLAQANLYNHLKNSSATNTVKKVASSTKQVLNQPEIAKASPVVRPKFNVTDYLTKKDFPLLEASFSEIIMVCKECFAQGQKESDTDEVYNFLSIKYPQYNKILHFLKNSSLYGNKSANLMELDNICARLNKEGVAVQVPAILPISHYTIEKFLETHSLKLDQLWLEFEAAQGDERKCLTLEAKRVLEGIQKSIYDIFENHKFNSSEIEAWLVNQQEKPLLMVRSTGKEDTDTVANAGGNDSISAVPANNKEISSAMAQVISSSCFSSKSIEQRLLAGDDILQKPFIPVLVQRMVGEKLGGAEQEKSIPVCGVTYAYEAEGRTPGWNHVR
jgi:hypothetical protein